MVTTMCAKTHSIYTIVGLSSQLDIQQGIYYPIITIGPPTGLALLLQSIIKYNIPLGHSFTDSTWACHMTQHTICNINMQLLTNINMQFQHAINYSINK